MTPMKPANHVAAGEQAFDEAVRAEKLALLTRNRADHYVGIVAAGATIFFLQHLYPLWLLECWFGLTCGLVLARAYLARLCNAAPLSPQSVRGWARMFTGSNILGGLLWGLTGTAILLSPDPTIHFIVIIVTGGMMAGGLMFSAAYRPAMLAFALSTELPVVAALFARHDRLHEVLAALVCFYIVLLIVAGLKISRIIADNIGMRLTQKQLLDKVQASEAAMAEAQELAQTGSWLHDLKTNVISLSAEAYRIFGIDPANRAPDFGLIMARVHPDDKALVDARRAILHLAPAQNRLEHRLIMDDGAIKHLRIIPKTIFDAGGEPVRVAGSVQDITESRLAQEQLQFANTLLKTQMEASPDGILVVDASGKIVTLNKRYGEISRTQIDDLEGKDFLTVVDRVSGWMKDEAAFRRRTAILTANLSESSEAEFELSDGRFVSRYMTALRGPDGGYLGRAWFYTDITERRAAAEKLQFANILLSTQMEASPDGIMVIDTTGRITAINQRFGEIHRIESGGLLGQHFQAFIDHIEAGMKDPAGFLRRMALVAANPAGQSEDMFEFADGRFIKVYRTPLHAANGDYLGRAVFCADITETKRAADALAYRDRLLRAVTAATALAVAALTTQEDAEASLAKIGESMEVDRIIVFRRARDETNSIAAVFTWQSAATLDRPFQLAEAVLPDLDAAELAAWHQPLHDGKPVITQRATAQGSIRRVMEHHGTESALFMPIFVGGTYWGFLSLAVCAAPRDWAASEIETIGILAEITGSLLARERARIALATSERRFRLLTTAAQDAIMLTNEDAIIIQWNQGAEHMFGYTASEALGQNVIDLIGKRDRWPEVQPRVDSLTPGTGTSMELLLRRKDGGEIWCDVSISAAAIGQKVEYLTIARDISARKTAEQNLQFANTVLQTQMDSSRDAIVILKPDGNIAAVNKRFGEIGNVRIDDLPGQHISVAVQRASAVAKDPAAFLRRMAHLSENPNAPSDEAFELADGRFIIGYRTLLTGPNGETLGRAAFYTDITESKRAADALAYRDRLLRTVATATTAAVGMVNSEEDIKAAVARIGEGMAVDRIMLVRDKQAGARPVYIVHAWESAAVNVSCQSAAPSQQDVEQAELAAALQDGQPVINQRATAQGSLRKLMEHYGTESSLLMPVVVSGKFWGFLCVDTCAAPRDWSPSEIETIGILAEMTGALIARERARLVLATSERRFRLLTTAARDAVLLTDQQSIVLQWNQAAEQMLGYTQAEALGQNVISLLALRSQWTEVENALATLTRNSGASLELLIRRKDGAEIWAEVSISGARIGDRVEFITIMRDITARKIAEQKLQFANILLNTQMEASRDGIIVTDASARIISMNQRYSEIVGVRVDDLLGQNVFVALERVSRGFKDPGAFMRRMQSHAASPATGAEEAYEFADGRFVTGYRTALHGPNGDYLGRAAFYTDITERKIAEQKLQFANALLNTQMEASPDGILVADHNGKIIAVNQRYGIVSQTRIDDMVGQDFAVAVQRVSALVKDPAAFLARAAAWGKAVDESLAAEIEMADGRIIDIYRTPLRAANGDYLGRAVFCADITERRRAEEKLQFANTVLKTQMESSRDAILVIDSSGRTVAVNQRFEEISGIPFDDLIGQDVSVAIQRASQTMKDPGAFLRGVAAMAESPAFLNSEAEYELVNGRFVTGYRTALHGPDGEYLGRASFFTDVTESRRAAEALAYRDHLLHTVTVATATAIAAASTEDGINAALAKIGEGMGVDRIIAFRIERDDGLPLSVLYAWQTPALSQPFQLAEITLHDLDEAELAAWLQPLEEGKPVLSQRATARGSVLRVMAYHGTQSSLKAPVFVNGALWGFLGVDACAAPRDWTASETETIAILAEITGSLISREQARIALATSERRFRQLTSTAQDGVMLTDEGSTVLQWNQGAERMYGYTEAEALGQNAVDLLGLRAQWPEIQRRLASITRNRGLSLELTARAKDGNEIWVDASISAARVGGRLEFITIMRDISERKIAEQKLQFANVLLKTQMDAARDGIIVADPSGKLVAINRRYAEMVNTPVEDLLGQHSSVVLQIIGGLLKDDETRQRAASWVTSPDYGMEELFELADGRIITGYRTPLYAETGEYLGRATFHSDITERKTSEAKLQFANVVLNTQMEASRDGILVIDSTGKVFAVNRRYGEISQTRIDDLVGQHVSVAVERASRPMKDPEAFLAHMAVMAETPELFTAQDEFEYADGRFSTGYRTALYGPNGEILGRAGFYTDITESKRAADALAYRDRLLRSVAAGTAIAIGAPTLGEGVPAALAQLGETMGVDRIIVTQIMPRKTPPMEVQFLWESPAVPRRFEIATDLSPSEAKELDAFAAPLFKGQPVIGHLSSAAGAVKALLARFGTQSCLLMPVSFGGVVWGYLSIDTCAAPRDWAASEVETIGLLAEITSSLVQRERARVALETSERRFRQLTNTARDAVMVTNERAIIRQWNRAAEEMFGYSAAEVLGQDLVVLLGRRGQRAEMARKLAAFVESGGRLLELPFRRKDGSDLLVELSTSATKIEDTLEYISIMRDISERKIAEQNLVLSNALLKTQIDVSPDGIFIVGQDSKYLSYNQRFLEMWSITEAQMQAAPKGWVREAIAKSLKDPEGFTSRLDYLNQHPEEVANDEMETIDGRIFERHSIGIRTAAGDILGRAWFYRDVTARRAAEAQALRLARYDSLTGLVNRALFVDALGHVIAHAKRDKTRFAVLFLDLDHFKDVNDTLGHAAGDTLLKAVATRLLAATRETDTVARFGGDEFAVILSSVQDAAGAAVLAERVLTTLNGPLTIDTNTVQVRASIGIELFSENAEDSETLLAHADVALYRAKAEGRGTFRFFTDDMDQDVRNRVTLGTQLREAIAGGALLLLYQPQIEATTGAVTGVEALLRWPHPTRGLLSAKSFMEAAESSGAVNELGRFALWTACRQAAAWRRAGYFLPKISLNISAMQLKTATTLEADIVEALAETGLPPDILELEITESALVGTANETNNVLRRLKERGVKFAIDHFGTGYSSLDYLRRFPADHIKIPGTFTKDIETETSNASIVRAIIGLANELDVATIAEGIETRNQLNLVVRWGCTQMQGFYFSPPIPPEEMSVILSAGGIFSAGRSPKTSLPQLPVPAPPPLLETDN